MKLECPMGRPVCNFIAIYKGSMCLGVCNGMYACLGELYSSNRLRLSNPL